MRISLKCFNVYVIVHEQLILPKSLETIKLKFCFAFAVFKVWKCPLPSRQTLHSKLQIAIHKRLGIKVYNYWLSSPIYSWQMKKVKMSIIMSTLLCWCSGICSYHQRVKFRFMDWNANIFAVLKVCKRAWSWWPL